MSLKEKFFAAKGELRCEEHKLPDGSILYVREVGSDEWADIRIRSYRHRTANGGGPDLLFDARLMAHSVTDDKKNLVFDPHDDEELTRLSKEPARTFDPLMKVVNRVNAASEEEHEALKKSSDNAPNLTLSTGLPETPAA